MTPCGCRVVLGPKSIEREMMTISGGHRQMFKISCRRHSREMTLKEASSDDATRREGRILGLESIERETMTKSGDHHEMFKISCRRHKIFHVSSSARGESTLRGSLQLLRRFNVREPVGSRNRSTD